MSPDNSTNPVNNEVQIEFVDPNDQAAVERFSGAHEGADNTISPELRDSVHAANAEAIQAARDRLASEVDVETFVPPPNRRYYWAGRVVRREEGFKGII